MKSEVLNRWRKWNCADLKDEDLVTELNDIRQNDNELTDRFYRDLEFGTGGLRGVIGVGTNRMNIYTVGKATQGYANYLNRKFAAPSVAIAYDSRIKSDVFARHAACVLAANGIKVHLYQELMPTPSLSFAVRYLKCSGGIVITASHNPAKYNGYKVYGSDGGQITTETADSILKEIDVIDPFSDVKYIDFDNAVSRELISYIEEKAIAAYIEAVSTQALCGNEINKDISIIYTPLNGSGLRCVMRTLKNNGFTNIAVVKEQERPDGNFPTCPYPNPEMKEALTLGIQYALQLGSELLLATDPDCDRVGTAVKSEDGYVLLSGNEMGLLLFDYICKRRIALGKMPHHPILVKTIVTTDLAKLIAADYGVEVIDVLTGFKYIGEQIGILETKGETERYIFGFEESYGYLSGAFVRDKDGVNASLLICEMFAYYKSHGQTLPEVLDALYQKYGYCLNTLRSYTFEGAAGFDTMAKIMENFRTAPPSAIAGKSVTAISDYKTSKTINADGSHTTIDLPKSNVIKFMLEGNSSVVIRPSGTEPKLKLYISVNAASRSEAGMAEEAIAFDLEKVYLFK